MNSNQASAPVEPTLYGTIKVDSWRMLNSVLEDLSKDRSWICRGQRCGSWDLRTSLERHTPVSEPRDHAESTLLTEFRRRAHTYLPQQLIPNERNDGEWLALMQHFGAPTRLLDATYSPYVATYFAVEDVADEDCCAVWAVDQNWCYEAAGRVILAGASAADRERAGAAASRTGVTPEFIQGVESSRLHYQGWREKKIAVVVTYTPGRLSERMSAQQGTFLVPRDVTRPFMDNLKAMGELQGVVKILIPANTGMRGTILERLRAMNIQRASLFPGLEGFAQSFRTLLLQEPEELRARLRVVQGPPEHPMPGQHGGSELSSEIAPPPVPSGTKE